MKEAAELIAELRAALEIVTPGPWRHVEADEDEHIDAPYLGDERKRISIAWDMRGAELAYFLAVQPDNIRLLLDHIESLRGPRCSA